MKRLVKCRRSSKSGVTQHVNVSRNWTPQFSLETSSKKNARLLREKIRTLHFLKIRNSIKK